MRTVLDLIDLGFYGPHPGETHVNLVRRKRPRDLAWEVGCWLLNALGVFAGQAMTFKDGVDFDPHHVSLRRFLACLALGLPAFVYFMRKVNAKLPAPGFLHIAAPFTCGFLFGKLPVKMVGKLRGLLS